MTRSPMLIRSAAACALAAFAGGAIAAHADSNGSAPRAHAPSAARAAVAARARVATRVLMPAASLAPACPVVPRQQRTSAGAPPSQALLGAFAILTRERRPEDALPPEALAALKARGLAPVDPASARLLRTTASGGRAWIVPVPDIGQASPRCIVVRRGKLVPRKPREGVAVVALGDAAAGGGGALDDLVRGRAPVSVDPCAGPSHDMLSVSGIVPNGVASVYLTAPDGTAVRTDVHDNGYELVVARPRTLEPRYVVWTGGDGTPHVQPLSSDGLPLIVGRCATPVKLPPRVTPGPFAVCGPVFAKGVLLPKAPAVIMRARREPLPRVPPPGLIASCPAVTTAPVGVFVQPAPPPVPRKHR